MKNEQYLESIGVTDEATQQKCLQLNEDLALCSKFSQLHEAVELLLGRPVFTHEFGIDIAGLRQEAERAWIYQVGVTSEAERQERVVESIDKLRKWAKENNKQVIDIQLPAQ